MENKIILITWWTWFLWSHLLERLVFLNYSVILLKRSSSDTKRIQHILDTKQEHIMVVDIDTTSIEKIFEKNNIYIVMHLATLYKKNHSLNDLTDMIDSNVKFPSLLCELCIKYWVNYFVNTWTFFEYDHIKDQDTMLNEKSKEKAFNLYASNKLAFNEILEFYCENYEFKGINLRLFSPYWPKDNEKLIPLIIKSILQKKELKLSAGEQKLTFTYVDDVVDAYVKSILYIERMKNKYEIFNIGYNQPASIKEIVEWVRNIVGRKDDTIRLGEIPYGENEIFYSGCDTTKAKTLLDWKPLYNIEQWLHLTYNYYKNEIQ